MGWTGVVGISNERKEVKSIGVAFIPPCTHLHIITTFFCSFMTITDQKQGWVGLLQAVDNGLCTTFYRHHYQQPAQTQCRVAWHMSFVFAEGFRI